MPITKSAAPENGIPVNYHRAIRLEVDLAASFAKVYVNSFASEAGAMSGLPIAWQWCVLVPVDQLAGKGPTLLGEIEATLVTLDSSPFLGGAIIGDMSDTVDAARERAWASVKAARAVAEGGNFFYDGDVYQINQEKVIGCVLAAKLAKEAGTPYSQDWTLLDNSVRTLDADQVIGMGLAMLVTIDGIYSTARSLRSQIDAAETIDAALAVTWPAPESNSTIAALTQTG